jgi:hypothetical protein
MAAADTFGAEEALSCVVLADAAAGTTAAAHANAAAAARHARLADGDAGI